MFQPKMLAKVFALSVLCLQISAQEIPPNPIALYNEATQLYFARNYKEAKKIFEQLITAFPADTGLFSYYLNSVEQADGKEARKEATKRCLPFYEVVPEEKRNERFYFDYITALRTLGKRTEADNMQKVYGDKFPDNSTSKAYKIQSILKEKDLLKASEMLLALINEKDRTGFVNQQIAESLLELTAANPQIFSREKILSSAEKVEKFAFKDTEPESLKQQQARYLSTLIKINNSLRPKFPHESMVYLKKAKEFYTANLPRNNNLEKYDIWLQTAELETLSDLPNWTEASKVAVKLIAKFEANKTDDIAEREATVRFHYAKALEGLKQINPAREQLALASAFNPQYQTDFDKFSLRYPLSSEAKKAFEAKISGLIESNLKTLEGKAKEKIAKEIINKPAKEFKIIDFSGKTASLADYKGKVLILNFWATWCVPCINEFKDMQTVYAKYANNPNVAFAMISTDEETKAVLPFIQKNGYKFPVWLAGDAITKDYEINSIPRLIIIDAKGNIRFDKRGYGKDILYQKKLDWMIESALK